MLYTQYIHDIMKYCGYGIRLPWHTIRALLKILQYVQENILWIHIHTTTSLISLIEHTFFIRILIFSDIPSSFSSYNRLFSSLISHCHFPSSYSSNGFEFSSFLQDTYHHHHHFFIRVRRFSSVILLESSFIINNGHCYLLHNFPSYYHSFDGDTYTPR